MNQEPLRLRLQEVMTLGGLTQTQVARDAGVTQSTLSRFLRGGSVADATAQRLEQWLEHQSSEVPLPDSTEVQAAVRLYRWLHRIIDEGGTLSIRFSDGREQALLILM